jgi:hypothetical protein
MSKGLCVVITIIIFVVIYRGQVFKEGSLLVLMAWVGLRCLFGPLSLHSCEVKLVSFASWLHDVDGQRAGV